MIKIIKSIPFRLVLALGVGVLLGLIANEAVINVILSVRHISTQFVLFCVPLIILGTVAPSIVHLGKNASRLVGFSVLIIYTVTLLASAFAAVIGYLVIPNLSIAETAEARRALPSMIFELNIPPVIAVMSALVLAVIIGLAVTWAKAEKFSGLLEEFKNIISLIISKIVLPVLPVLVMSVFTIMTYDGRLTSQLPVFIQLILIVIAAHFVWLAILYTLSGIISKRNPIEVIKHYGSTYLTGFGTMSSAATLGVALDGAKKSKVLDKDMVNFGIPFFAHFHMCGAAITVVLLSLTVSKIVFGTLPGLEIIIIYLVIQGIFTMAGPGVPAGVLMASLGLLTALFGFDETAVGLMILLWALQDSSGTACNISSDGALIMILSRYKEKKEKKENSDT